LTSDINQYSQYYENASDSALVLDENNVILDCNNNTCDFLKYSQIELIDQKAEIIFENSAVMEFLKQSDFSIRNSGNQPVYIYDRAGDKKPVSIKVIPLDVDNPNRKLLVIKDLTSATEAEKKIREFENKAALGDMIADFAHEVRNPMNSFVSGLQVVKKKMATDDSLRSTIEQMQDDCMRINDLMESVLSYSRQKVENFKEVDLEMLLRRILNQNNMKFRQNKVETLFKTTVPHATTMGDQRSLEQAFVNLINNAYDAIKQDGGMISVQIDQKGNANEFLEVSISDTGPGIPPEIKEKLFEPFVTGKPKGTGLGLAITKRMVEAHQGKIELETYPGGTIFKVILHNQAIQGEPA
jgi:PAS domain S-box-containing protein